MTRLLLHTEQLRGEEGEVKTRHTEVIQSSLLPKEVFSSPSKALIHSHSKVKLVKPSEAIQIAILAETKQIWIKKLP